MSFLEDKTEKEPSSAEVTPEIFSNEVLFPNNMLAKGIGRFEDHCQF